MSNRTRRDFLSTVPVALAAASLDPERLTAETAQAASDLSLRFDKPAREWAEALPIGNGRLGAMVFGGVADERIQLNEDTLWSGQPSDGNNHGAFQHLAEVRRLVLQEKNYVEADQVCKKMQGHFNESYQPLADLRLQLPASGGPVSEYSRSLNLDTAVASVTYKVGESRITREAFVSAPDQVIAVRLRTDTPGRMSFSILLSTVHKAEVTTTKAGELTLAGKAPSHVEPNYRNSPEPVAYDDSEGKGMRFAAILRARVQDGKVTATPTDAGTRLDVRNATACVILINAATGFRGYDAIPDLKADVILDRIRRSIDSASQKSWNQLLAAHIRDHQLLFRRVSLELGTASVPPDLRSTPDRLAATSKHADPRLLALYFHYGRYLLIASSRPGTQPANLQGIWNESVRPPWSANWTANINIQMNYWHAETCNLAECHEPVFDLMEGVAQNGSRTAKIHYGAEGWCSHHNIDIWRPTCPVGLGTGSPTWANWQMSGPWLCSHLWEHYRFSGNSEFLRTRAYPLMKGAARFCLSWLIDDGEGRLTTCPSFSTENDFQTPDGRKAETSAGCTMDIALIRELFTNCLSAARILQAGEPDAKFLGKMRQALAKLPPYRVGRYGQLQEWSEDFAEATLGQRHMSHLYGLYPGNDISPRSTPDLAKAARVSLERRLANGGAYTGWSRAWAIGFWARLADGAKAEESLTMLLKHSTGANLFDTHPATDGSIFQIDGNFGATAAMAEMLLQSHENEIALLPALPSNWQEGAFRGLKARGGIEVDLAWKSGKAVGGRLQSVSASSVLVRAPRGQRVQDHEVANINLPAGTPVQLGFTGG